MSNVCLDKMEPCCTSAFCLAVNDGWSDLFSRKKKGDITPWQAYLDRTAGWSIHFMILLPMMGVLAKNYNLGFMQKMNLMGDSDLVKVISPSLNYLIFPFIMSFIGSCLRSCFNKIEKNDKIDSGLPLIREFSRLEAVSIIGVNFILQTVVAILQMSASTDTGTQNMASMYGDVLFTFLGQLLLGVLAANLIKGAATHCLPKLSCCNRGRSETRVSGFDLGDSVRTLRGSMVMTRPDPLPQQEQPLLDQGANSSNSLSSGF